MNELFKLEIFTDVHCIICWKLSTYWGLDSKPHRQSKYNEFTGWSNLCEFHHIDSVVCMHSQWRLGMLLMSWHMVSWGISSQTWIRASVGSWTVCGGTWWRRIHRYTMSHRCLQTLSLSCHMCLVWTCSNLWREWGASGRPANFVVLWWMPIKVHGAGLWAQVPPEDVCSLCHPHGVFLWQFGQKHARQ